MSDHVDVPDLGGKILLLLRSDRKSIKSTTDLIKKLGVGKDYWSRIRGGTRVLTEEKFLKLCEIFSMEQKEWLEPLLEFGIRLGFSRNQVALITNTPLPGIDFNSRIRDERIVGDIFATIEGYWESFYFSVSKVDQRLVSRDLWIVRRVNEDGFIECEIADPVFGYKGWCFPVKNHLYMILEKSQLTNEIIVYATNLPDRTPPRLFGIILCLSGGVDEMHSFPCAAKVAFRYLGRETEVRKKYGLRAEQDVETYLAENTPIYVDPEDSTLDDDTRGIIRDISNVLSNKVVPSALRMTK